MKNSKNDENITNEISTNDENTIKKLAKSTNIKLNGIVDKETEKTISIKTGSSIFVILKDEIIDLIRYKTEEEGKQIVDIYIAKDANILQKVILTPEETIEAITMESLNFRRIGEIFADCGTECSRCTTECSRCTTECSRCIDDTECSRCIGLGNRYRNYGTFRRRFRKYID